MLAGSTVLADPHTAVISRRRAAGQYIYIYILDATWGAKAPHSARHSDFPSLRAKSQISELKLKAKTSELKTSELKLWTSALKSGGQSPELRAQAQAQDLRAKGQELRAQASGLRAKAQDLRAKVTSGDNGIMKEDPEHNLGPI